nr:hypothetical protein [Pseudomonadota bacterium]
AATRIARVEQASAPVAVAVNDTDTVTVNPFAPDAAAITTRPWPRAILPNAGGAFNVRYGNLQPASDVPAEAHPFRPSNPSPR